MNWSLEVICSLERQSKDVLWSHIPDETIRCPGINHCIFRTASQQKEEKVGDIYTEKSIISSDDGI